MYAPEKVVRPFFLRRHLERLDVALLDVAELEDLPDRAVLAAGVAALQDDEQPVGARVGEQVLELGQLLSELLDPFQAVVFFQAVGVRRR